MESCLSHVTIPLYFVPSHWLFIIIVLTKDSHLCLAGKGFHHNIATNRFWLYLALTTSYSSTAMLQPLTNIYLYFVFANLQNPLGCWNSKTNLGYGRVGEAEVMKGVEGGVAGGDEVGGEGEGGWQVGEERGGRGGGEGGGEAGVWRLCELVAWWEKMEWNLKSWTWRFLLYLQRFIHSSILQLPCSHLSERRWRRERCAVRWRRWRSTTSSFSTSFAGLAIWSMMLLLLLKVFQVRSQGIGCNQPGGQWRLGWLEIR